MLIGLHAFIAMQTDMPHWNLEEAEAKSFTRACQNVARHYNVQTTQKAIDIMALMGCIGTVYGTRLMATKFERDARRNAAQQGTAGVIQFPQQPYNFNPTG